jgi:hypothetical protein
MGSNCPKLLKIEKSIKFDYPNFLIARRMNGLEPFQFVKSYYTENMDDKESEKESLASWSDDYEDEEEANDVKWIFE